MIRKSFFTDRFDVGQDGADCLLSAYNVGLGLLVFKLHCICHFSQSALQLTEVLKERDAQLEFKQLKEAAMQGKDKAYLEQAQRDLEEAIRRDQEEAQKRIIAAKQNKGFIKAQ